MEILVDTDLQHFNAWAGGLEVLEDLRKHPDAFDYVDSFLEEPDVFGPDFIREVDVNDFLWFDCLELLEENGFYNSQSGKWYDEEGFEEVCE